MLKMEIWNVLCWYGPNACAVHDVLTRISLCRTRQMNSHCECGKSIISVIRCIDEELEDALSIAHFMGTSVYIWLT